MLHTTDRPGLTVCQFHPVCRILKPLISFYFLSVTLCRSRRQSETEFLFMHAPCLSSPRRGCVHYDRELIQVWKKYRMISLFLNSFDFCVFPITSLCLSRMDRWMEVEVYFQLRPFYNYHFVKFKFLNVVRKV